MPDTFTGKTYWLVGASEGLGRALAQQLDREGANVIVSARNADRLETLVDEMTNARSLPLDVTDPVSVEAACKELGPVDGIIYCAGYYDPLSARNWDARAIDGMMDVNFTGALRVLAGTVPAMIKAGQGHIVLIGSLAGFRGLPEAMGYGASKAALMHLAENLRADLGPAGLQVQCVNPGFIKTRLTDKNDFKMPQIMSPEKASDAVVSAMRSGRFSTSFPSPFSWLFRGGRFLPIDFFHRLFASK